MKRLLLLPGVLLLAPALAIAVLRVLPPPTTAFMLQSAVRPVQHDWVPLQAIAPVLAEAVIAAEDQKFRTHAGFDFEAMRQALRENRVEGRQRGASTISQQTAKNLFLWPGGGYWRKAIEAYLTLWIEALWPKDRILEVYLNIAEFGPGIYGAEAAAQAFFNKPARRLTAEEAAGLAAVLPNPRRWRAARPGPYVERRTAWILQQMGYAPARQPQLDEPLEPEEEEPDEAAPGAPEPAAVPDAGSAPAVNEAPASASPGAEAMEPAEPDSPFLPDAGPSGQDGQTMPAEGATAPPAREPLRGTEGATPPPSTEAPTPRREDPPAQEDAPPDPPQSERF